MQKFRKVVSIIIVFVYLFTAMPWLFPGNTGIMQAYAEEGMTDETAVYADIAALNNMFSTNGWNDPGGITATKITLPTTGENGSEITWTSSDEYLVDTDGNIRIPSFSTLNYYYKSNYISVALTATVSRGEVSHNTNCYIYITSSREETEQDTLAIEDYEYVTDTIRSEGWDNSEGYDGDHLDFPLNEDLPKGSTISWSSDQTEVIAPNGAINRPALGEGEKSVEVSFLITRGPDIKLNGTYTVRIRSFEDDLKADKEWLTAEMILDENTAENVSKRLNMPKAGPNLSTITWSFSEDGFILPSGTVMRPTGAQGNKTITLMATFTRGTITDTKTFEFIVKASSSEEEESLLEADVNWIENDFFRYKNLDDMREYNLNLPVTGPNGSAISWASSNTDIISVTGKVTRPAFSRYKGHAPVTLTATVTRRDASTVKTFDIKVYPDYPTNRDRVLYCIENSLTDEGVLHGNDPLYVKTNLYLPTSNGYIYYQDMSIGNCVILWESSHPEVIATDGTVTRPLKGQPSVTVTLTAHISYFEETEDKVFTFVVTPLEEYPLAINYEDFSNKERLQFNGVSGTADTTNRSGESVTALKFSNGTESTGGSVFTKNRIRLGDNLSFSTAFTFRINNLTDYYDLEKSGAFTFTLQGASKDISADSLNDTTIKPSLSIAFTTSRSERGSGQLYANYVNINAQVFYNGDYSRATEKYSIGSFKANEQMDYHTIWIEYDGTRKVLELWFSTSGDRPDINYMHLEVENVDLGEILRGAGDGLTLEDVRNVYAGFMGSMGDAREDIEIYDWYLKNDSTPINKKIYDFYDVSDITLSAVASEDLLESILTITVSGKGGPMPAIPVELYTDRGTLSRSVVETDERGEATIVLSGSHVGIAHVKAIALGGAMAETEAPLSATDEDAVDFDIAWLNGAGLTLLLNGNSGRDDVSISLNLPSNGPNRSAISWSSDNAHINAEDGSITPPTPEEGDQQVTLTATLSKNTTVKTKTIIVTVKVPDSSAVPADDSGLTDDVILNGNSDWDSIITGLNMPATGQYGSSISWTSSSQQIIALDGTVNRPTYTEGDQTVNLTAVISKGASSITRNFTATVKALDPNDLEAVNLDHTWLTWDIFKKLNTSQHSVTSGLYLPGEGQNSTNISWTSSNTDFVAVNGNVVQPAFSQGKKKVTLTATISRGTKSVQKTFEITVVTLDQTDGEAVEADKNWLDISRTLGQNLSEFSIMEKLAIPASAPNESVVTWSSDKPGFISNTGVVTRPPSTQGHQVVKLTAVFKKGSAEATRIFSYTVLAEPDTTPPQITGMNTTDNGTQLKSYLPPFDNPVLPWKSNRIYINFDEDLEYWPVPGGNYSIEGPDAPSFWASRWENKIIFNINGLLKPGATYVLVIPARYVGDKYGNMPAEDIRIPVRVEERPARTIQVISSTPADREKEVSLDLTRVTLKFNYSDVIRGDNFRFIKLEDKYGASFAAFSGISLNGDEITIDLNKRLQAGQTYKVIIPAGTLTDYYKNQNIEQTIQFRAKNSLTLPKIESVYPQKGQTDVDIHQRIDVVFTEVTDPSVVRLWLRDEKGNSVSTLETRSLEGNRKKISIIPYQPLKPDTNYTLFGQHDSVENPSQMEFELSFRTGENKLGIIRTSPSDRATDVPINGAVEIEFSAPPMKGTGFSGIEFTDSEGNSVSFHGEERGNKALIIPDSDLNEDEVYFVRISKGAYKGQGDLTNDEYEFCFKTDKKLELQADLPDIPSTGLVGKTFRSSADRIDKLIKSENHEVISYQWDFADGSSGSSKDPEHIFSRTGDYLVKLTVQDNKGFFYEFEKEISIIPIQDVMMTVSREESNRLYIAKGWPNPSLKYNIRLECENLPVPGERISVELYKNGVLVRTYDEITSDSKNAYTFTFTAESNYVGNYQLVFTHISPGGTLKVRESVIITAYNATSYLRVQLYDTKNGEIYSEAEYLNVKVDGASKVAVREWIPSLNEYVYTVQEQFPILRYYKFELQGFREYGSQRMADFSNSDGILYNVGELGDFYSRPPVKAGFKPNVGLNKLVNVDILYKPFLIEGVDMGTTTFAVEGQWGGLTPGYYELKTTSGKLHKTSTSYSFELRPGTDFKAGDQLMMRMVSKNGISSNWVYWDLKVLPKPKILGMNVNVTYKDNNYYLSFSTPFGEIMGGGIPLLDDIPYLDGAEFGLGGGMPSFTGIIYKEIALSNPRVLVEADFSGEAAYSQKNKTTVGLNKNKHVKKVKTIGYEVEIKVEGWVSLFYDKQSGQWKTEYVIIDVGGYGGKSWSKGYSIAGIVGVEGKLELGAYIGGTLIVDRQESGSTEYSGIIEFSPGLEVSVTGSYGIGSVGGYVSADLPAELHLPTGYFEVGLDIEAKIIASFVTYSTPLYENKLVSLRWNNGKEKVVYRMLDSAELSDEETPETASTGLKLMDRNYLNRESVWLGDNATNSMLRAEVALRGSSLYSSGTSGPQSGVLMENIYPNAEIQLVQMGDELWMVWTDDNPERDAVNRTQLRYSVFENGTWSEPAWLDNDNTADFSPALASVPSGILLAWQDISKEISEEEGLSGMLENSEISVTASPFSTGGSFNMVTLTNDDKIDHSPRLAADGNNALLVWTKSEGLGFTVGEDMDDLKATANSDSLWFSKWSGSSWSEPVEIQGSMPSVLDSYLAVHENQGLLLYTLDMDSDMSTSKDREIFAVLFDGGSWGTPIRITNNDLNEINPKAAYINGDWFITWVQDGIIQYKAGLSGQTETWEITESVPNDYQLAVLDGEYPQVALVCKKTSDDLAQSLYAAFYDAELGVWSGEILLTQEDGYIQNLKPMFANDGRLTVSYSQAEVITEVIPAEIDGEEKLVEKSTVSDKVDLKVMTYVPEHDMAFDEEEGLQLSSVTPLPETVITVFATVVNQGDFAEEVIVDLYDGNPEAGGRKISSSDELTIPARSAMNVELEWLVPSEERVAYHLYAVIRPQRDILEKDESNNTISLVIQTANVYVDGLVCENAAKDDYILNAVIINNGAKAINDIEINLVHIDSGEIVKSESIRKLDPGQEFPVSMLFSAKGLEKDENGNINMALRAVLPDGVNEQSKDDNVLTFALVPAAIFVNGGYPSPDDTQVPVDSSITLSFNMNVEEGAGFNQITLEDEDLNVIEVIKSLDGDILTIAPANPLANSTQYTLTIPANALGDAYGHILAGPYTMSFKTTSHYPEVTFAWPGDGMEDADLNTEIKLLFNQDISKGPTYSDIALYGVNDTLVPASVSIDDSWLYIRSAGSLRKDTVYSIVIPRGAVANGDKALQEDYMLNFTTVNTGGNDDNSGNNSNNNSGGSKPTDSYNANIGATGSMQNVKLPVKVDSNAGKASIDLAKMGEEIFAADENIVISVPSIPGVNAYTLEMPASSLSHHNGKGTLTFETSVGSITVRPGMLSGMTGLDGKTAGINIAAGDKTRLPDEIREAIGARPLVQLTLTLDGEQMDWNNPSSPVTVTIPYTPSEEEGANPESIVVWYIDGSGRVVSVPNGRYDPATGTVTFITTHFSHYAVAYYPVSFKDVPADAWYKKAVDFIAARQITYGTGNGNYSPTAKITRGEFITLLMRAYDIAPDNDPTDNFEDAGNTYYTAYLATARRLGISKGTGNNLFSPDKEITRQEMFTLLYNALKVINRLPEGSSGKTLDDFTDAKEISLWAKDALTLFVETETVVGSKGKLTPNSNATRAEMAQILINLLLKYN